MRDEREIVAQRPIAPPGSGGENDTLATLLARIAGQDRAAYEELYRRIAPQLLATCLRILPDRAEAEEAFQDAFLAIWHRAAAFDVSRGTPVAWLLTLTRNRAIDRLRSGAKHSGLPLVAAQIVHDPQPGAADMLEQAQEDGRLKVCMETLAPQDLRLVRAAYLQGLRYAELSTQESIPVATIKTRVRRALLKLRECLR